jgi:aldehyde:ferredoxin oxidoreductase
VVWWIYPIFAAATEDRLGDTSLESQLLAGAVTFLDERELDRVGERVWNLGRSLMAREGRTREQDTLHESYFQNQGGEKAIPLTDFEEAKTRYYQLRGWDEKTGWPTREKLGELGLL